MTLSDETTEIVEEHPTPANSFYKDITFSFFADAAGTMPKSVTDLPVSVSTAITSHISGVDNTSTSFATTNYSGTTAVRTMQPIACCSTQTLVCCKDCNWTR